MEYPSKLIENAVEEIARLPGIGKKTALRLALHLIKEEESKTFALTDALNKLRTKTLFCVLCHNISDEKECIICQSKQRDRKLICVVEDARDVLAIENTGQYTGLYHVLGGVISPINGIGPSMLTIDKLINRISHAPDAIREIIFALSPTMEGDTTSFYISKQIKNQNLKISVIARGIPIGNNLEYTDEITLGRSITTRTLFT